jgi:hypothetical protein
MRWLDGIFMLRVVNDLDGCRREQARQDSGDGQGQETKDAHRLRAAER